MKKFTKKRFLSALLSLVLVASAAMPMMTSLLTPVEVGAIPGEGLTHYKDSHNIAKKRIVIFPASYIDANYALGQKAWWDETTYRPYQEWSFHSSCGLEGDYLKIKGWAGDYQSFGRVRINLNDIMGSETIAADKFTHVRLIYRTIPNEEPSKLDVQVMSSDRDKGGTGAMDKIGPDGKTKINSDGNIQAADWHFESEGGSTLLGNIDCLLIDIVGTIYIYAIQLFDASLDASIYNEYLNRVCATHCAAKVTIYPNNGSSSYLLGTYWGYNTFYVTLPAGPSKTGYTFSHWSEGTQTIGSNGNLTIYSSAQSSGKAFDCPINAHYNANTYTVKYNGNGNTGGSTANSSHTYDQAKNLTKNGYKKTGYTFSKWTTKKDGSGTSYKDQKSVSNLTATNGGTVTLYAQWTANTYTVSYDGNGASAGSTASTSHTYDQAKNLAANGFSRAGYTFAGWSTEKDGSGTTYTDKQSVSNLTTQNGDTVTLYAQWTAGSNKITYDPNGGSSVGEQTYTTDASFNLAAAPTKEGYTFDGWKVTTADGSWTSGTTYGAGEAVSGRRGNVTLTAQWSANTYTVVYLANDGTDATTSSTHTYNQAQSLTANEFTRPGYSFVGWNTAADGSGTTYTDGQSVINLTAVNGGTVTLYAQWESTGVSLFYFTAPAGYAELTVTEDILLVDKAAGTAVAKDGSVIKSITNGYAFGGWYTDEACTAPVDAAWVDEEGKLTVDLTGVSDLAGSYSFYAKIDYATQSVSIKATCDENAEQTVIYRIEGTPVLTDVFGEDLSLIVITLCTEDTSVEVVMPTGNYKVIEYSDWCWRYKENDAHERLVPAPDDGYRFEIRYTNPTNPHWLNDYSVATRRTSKKDPDTP